jgi:hypothetical protein
MPNRYMKITVIKDCQAGSVGIMLAGEDHDVREDEARKLIDRGYAKQWSAKIAKTAKIADQDND